MSTRRPVAVIVAAIALTGCGADAVPRTPPPSTAPASATPVNDTPAAPPTDMTPVAGTVIPGCAYVPASLVGSALGIPVAAPVPTVNRTVTLCQLSSRGNSAAVLVRFETNLALSDFKAEERAFAAHGQATSDVSGLGEAAYTSTTGSGSSPTTTVVAYKDGVSLEVVASVPLDRIEGLVRTLLRSL